jgi:hypothetical protein
MPYKRTGRPNGRPKADRDLPLISFDAAAGFAKSNVPEWWITMAMLEAEWKYSWKWRHGSIGELGREPARWLGDGKSFAAVNKVRSDKRYQFEVEKSLNMLFAFEARGAVPLISKCSLPSDEQRKGWSRQRREEWETRFLNSDNAAAKCVDLKADIIAAIERNGPPVAK